MAPVCDNQLDYQPTGVIMSGRWDLLARKDFVMRWSIDVLRKSIAILQIVDMHGEPFLRSSTCMENLPEKKDVRSNSNSDSVAVRR